MTRASIGRAFSVLTGLVLLMITRPSHANVGVSADAYPPVIQPGQTVRIVDGHGGYLTVRISAINSQLRENHTVTIDTTSTRRILEQRAQWLDNRQDNRTEARRQARLRRQAEENADDHAFLESLRRLRAQEEQDDQSLQKALRGAAAGPMQFLPDRSHEPSGATSVESLGSSPFYSGPQVTEVIEVPLQIEKRCPCGCACKAGTTDSIQRPFKRSGPQNAVPNPNPNNRNINTTGPVNRGPMQNQSTNRNPR